jgi:hypothetical protein
MCMECVLAYVRGICGIEYGQDAWSKMPMRAGMCLESMRLGQRAIAKKILSAWDDVIRPDQIIIFWRLADNPEVGRRFLVYKGRETGHNRQTDERWTDYERATDKEQTNKRCEPTVRTKEWYKSLERRSYSQSTYL